MLGWLNKKKQKPQGLIGLETGPEGIALAQIERDAEGRARLIRCLFRAATPAEQAQVLKEWVQELQLQGASVNFLLHPASYQLLLLDCPDVPEDELRDAMRWRLKDLISQSLDSVVTDLIALPADAYRGRSRMAYCAALEKQQMEQAARLLRQAGLRLQSIDITEMAFRNLGLQAGATGINLALLRLRSSEGLISVQNGVDLYMARRIEHGLERRRRRLRHPMTLEDPALARLLREPAGQGLYQSSAAAADASVMVLPCHAGAWAGGLAVKLQRAGPCEELFPVPTCQLLELDAVQQAYCMTAVGAALRQEARLMQNLNLYQHRASSSDGGPRRRHMLLGLVLLALFLALLHAGWQLLAAARSARQQLVLAEAQAQSEQESVLATANRPASVEPQLDPQLPAEGRCCARAENGQLQGLAELPAGAGPGSRSTGFVLSAAGPGSEHHPAQGRLWLTRYCIWIEGGRHPVAPRKGAAAEPAVALPELSATRWGSSAGVQAGGEFARTGVSNARAGRTMLDFDLSSQSRRPGGTADE